MSRRESCTRKAAAMVGAVLLIGGATLSPASALPVGADPAAGGAPLLTRVMVGEHLKYPGANSPAAKARRAQRNAPNYMCDKRPALCR